ncbi:MAG: sensor histidine kinase [bacterium]|jgi:chemotaxis family two-component system sensor kinase Cph1
MLEFFQKLFDTSDFPARWNCGVWTPGHGWLHILSDLMIWGAYVATPLVLAYFILKRKDIIFPSIFWLFCAFIFSCGTTHLIESVIFWWPIYRFAGVMKLITAIASWITVLVLIKITPDLLKLPGLAMVNVQLETEIETRKKVEMDLRRTVTELDEFTYSASHDLQEPLRMMGVFCDLLKKDAGENLSERALKDIDFISKASQRMQTLVQDLLKLSKTGRAEIKKETLSMEACVSQALENLALNLQEAENIIERDPLPDAVGDQTMIIQLYQNLISNAIKYTDKRPRKIKLTAELKNGKIVYGVKDNGIGIKPEYHDQIFFPFKRLHGQGEYEGSGIGLAICRKTVERHHGRIWVDSVPGEGAHFQFTLHTE